MHAQYQQITLKDTFSDCQDIFPDDTPSFFQLLEWHFDIILFIFQSFYQRLGQKSDYPLTGFLSVFILILLLNLYREFMFQQIVDYTKPICKQIDSSLSYTLTFDTSATELYVTENNPKLLIPLSKNSKFEPNTSRILLLIR